MINGIQDCESSPATGERVIRYMHKYRLTPCDECIAEDGPMVPTAHCEKHKEKKR